MSCIAPATSIEVLLGTDAPLDSTLTVAVWANEDEASARDDAGFVRTLPLQASSTFAGSFTLVPRAGATRDGPVAIRIEGTLVRGGLTQTLVYNAQTRFVPNVSNKLRVFLSTRCLTSASGCETVSDERCTVSVLCDERGLTCDRGECISREQPAGQLDGSFEERAPLVDAAPDASTDAPSCAGGLRLCNGACVDVTRSTAHCGRCGNNCASLAHVGSTSCTASACRVLSCAGDWANCDGVHSNGCESAVNQRTGLCACGLRCNSSYVCTNRRQNCCVLTASCNNSGDCSSGRRCIQISGGGRHCCY